MTHTVHDADLGWLELALIDAAPRHYPVPDPQADPAVVALPPLRVPPELAAKAAGAQLTLLDPEGVPVATVEVVQAGPDWVAGPITPGDPITHHDHTSERAAFDSPAGPVHALVASTPAAFAVREALRRTARSRGGAVIEIVPVPTGRETDRHAHRWPRLAHREATRDPGDRIVVVPDPEGVHPISRLAVLVGLARRLGAEHVVVPPTDRTAATAVAAATRLPVDVVDVDPAQAGLADEDLTRLLDTGAELPDWFAEPAVAQEWHTLHRSRAHAGLTVLFTGFSGSGKSTVARALVSRLMDSDPRSVALLDGDVVRHHLSKGLGFSRADRDTNVRRIGYVASEITKAGGIAVAAPIAPYAATRADVRAMVEGQGGFVLVHVSTSLAECERRDRKGLYAKARRGEIPEFTGISDPYEVPDDAEIVVDTTNRSVDAAVDLVWAQLSALGYLSD